MTEPEQPQYPYEPPPNPYQAPPPYGQPPYGQQPWQPGPPPPPPARKPSRLPWIIAAIVVVAAVAIGAVVFAVTKDDNKNGTKGGGGGNGPIALPETFAGYTRIHSSSADTVEKTIRSLWANTPAKALSDKATIGTYAEGATETPALIGVAFPASLKATVGGSNASDDSVASELLSYAGGDTDSYDAGAHGGVLRCARATMGATEEVTCAWSDDTVIGMTIVPGTALSEDDLANVTNQLRDKVG